MLIPTNVGEEYAQPFLRGEGISSGWEIGLDNVHDLKECLLVEPVHLTELLIRVDPQDVGPLPDNPGLPDHWWNQVPFGVGGCPPPFPLCAHLLLLPFVIACARHSGHGFRITIFDEPSVYFISKLFVRRLFKFFVWIVG